MLSRALPPGPRRRQTLSSGAAIGKVWMWSDTAAGKREPSVMASVRYCRGVCVFAWRCPVAETVEHGASGCLVHRVVNVESCSISDTCEQDQQAACRQCSEKVAWRTHFAIRHELAQNELNATDSVARKGLGIFVSMSKKALSIPARA